MFRKLKIQMVIFDLPTIINDKALIHNSIYHTVRLINPNIKKQELLPFYNTHRNEIIEHFVNQQKISSPEIIKQNLASEFHYFFKKELLMNPKNLLIHKQIPTLFSTLKDDNIKVVITSDYSSYIQDSIINQFYFKDKIDEFWFDSSISNINNNIKTLSINNKLDNINKVITVNNYLSQQTNFKITHITINKHSKIKINDSNIVVVPCIMDITSYF